MNPRRFQGVALAGAAIVLAASAAACISTDQPTPIYVYLTPSPEASVEVTAAPSPTETPSPEITTTPSVAASPSDTAIPSLAPTPESTSAPGDDCVGSAANKSFFVEAAKGIKAPIFCTSNMPSGWVLSVGNWHGNSSGGWIDVTYRYKKTSQTVQIKEGAFCMNSNPTTCTGGALLAVQSGVAFDGMATNLVTTGGSDLEMILNPGKYNAYFLIAQNVAKTTVISIGANMKVVPKS